MTPGRKPLLGLALLALGAVAWLMWPQADQTAPQVSASAVAAATQQQASASAATRAAPWPPVLQDAEAALQRVPLQPVDQSQSATQSLARAHENGDARTPPLKHAQDQTPAATAAELADPKAYQRYEERQNLRLYAAFNQAATAALPKLRDDIERGRAAGIAPEQIAKVEEKVRRIEAEQAKLLKEHPALAH
jgi:hypothetical protein